MIFVGVSVHLMKKRYHTVEKYCEHLPKAALCHDMIYPFHNTNVFDGPQLPHCYEIINALLF